MTPMNGRCIVGLVGAGIGASLSPALHETAADRLGLRYVYQVIDLDELELNASAIGELLADAQRLGFRGLNVTHPCKQLVLEWLDDVAPGAVALGAVNTVVFDGGRSIGHNTDVFGFRESFVRSLPDAPLDAVVLVGAGGAGAAVAHALMELGTRALTILDLEHNARVDLAAAVNARFPEATCPRCAAREARRSVERRVRGRPRDADGHGGASRDRDRTVAPP